MNTEARIDTLYREAELCDDASRLFRIARELETLGAWDYAQTVEGWAWDKLGTVEA